jgi:3-isopropylmalate/(R)-2-methylmalate dehydratase small subunit
MDKFTPIHSRIAVLPVNNIDTDQIIPARFLKGTDKIGLGANLFADWRYNPDGAPNAGFVLNQPGAQDSHILLAGDNFGCGSSREHAPWALIGFGFRAIVAKSFADIFRNNALKNGLLPVQIDHHAHQAMLEFLHCWPEAEFTIDLWHQTVTWPEGNEAHFPIDPFVKTCLLQGVDELGYLLSHEEHITAFERGLEFPRAIAL